MSRAHVIAALAVAVFVCFATPACGSSADAGAATVTTFFRHLESHEFDAAADVVRDSATLPMPDRTRQQYIAGWRKEYEGYRIQFTKIVVRTLTGAPSQDVQAAQAGEGYVYDVMFEGTSNSPCVPVSSSVIPLLTHPVAMRASSGSWFLTTSSMVGSINNCPGA